MSVKHKHYPHPVLESQFDIMDEDFVDSYFDVSINPKLDEDGTRLKVEVIFDLKNDSLTNLICDGKAIFALLFVCEAVSTRSLVYTNKFEYEFNLDAEALNKTVTIQPYILAESDIKNYQNTCLIEPLKQIAFGVKRGDILAIAADTEIYIEKENLFNIESIFELTEISGNSDKLVSFNPNNTKIQILVSPKIHKKIREFSNFKGSISDILISLFYLPSVVHALNNIVSLREEDGGDTKLLEYKDYKWYRTLEKKLYKLKLGDDLSNIREDDVDNIAQNLMENPNYKALLAIDDLIYGTEESG